MRLTKYQKQEQEKERREQKRIWLFENETGRKFNYDGPPVSKCPDCGMPYQYEKDHWCFIRAERRNAEAMKCHETHFYNYYK